MALSQQLQLRPRDLAAEQAALQRLAAWALQFTPHVSVVGDDALLLDIGSCLAFFRGLTPLLQRLDTGLASLGYSCQRGCAPTPLAALWRARAGCTLPVEQAGGLEAALQPLPLTVMRLPTEVEHSLNLMGIQQLGPLLQLPAAGLGRRFGAWLPQQLQQALGQLPDPRPAFTAPACFSSRLELAWATERTEDLLLVLRRLLIELCGYLAGCALGVQQVRLRLEHENRQQTEIDMGFGQPSRQPAYLLAIARERLERLELQATVAALELHADQLLPLQACSDDLFGDGSPAGDLQLLHSRLRARLGEQAVQGVALVADHRPERAWRVVPVQLARRPSPQVAGRGLRRPAVVPEAAPSDLPSGRRPTWLLAEPQALRVVEHRPWYGEPLLCPGRPERVESGWWDGTPVSRDYYWARGQHSGRLLWIFQERASQQWFVHGLFD